MKIFHLAAAAALAVIAQGTFKAQAAISIDLVQIGNAGNAPDTTTYGAVGYNYAINKYDVTVGQYTEFLNSVAATDTYNLYNTSMGGDVNVTGITQSGTSGNFTYAARGSANTPITYVSWFDAARFSNWMANGQPTGAQVGTTTENGAYTLNGAMSGVLFTKNTTNPNTSAVTTFWIPSEDEWYKAAYYDPNKAGGAGYYLYPTMSNSAPGNTIGSGANQANINLSTGSAPFLTDVGAFSGSGSAYGTYDQGGNVAQWNDAVIAGSFRGKRGGTFYGDASCLLSSNRFHGDPADESQEVGFRLASLASVPEPSTMGFMLATGAGWLVWKRRKITP